ncbi:putative F-box protein At3g16210 [Neltuma alba]|uniref:putative F-box protein At3g16210 n=1 Tax=Neltuma alba TaxID=207710 RepID=UPI0010A3F696|nr:putative F-box protein At3g16210 [Prosopis alba]XP_028798011.1 putative F-box protein At3g16210 [Prosopis alba]
MAATVTMPEMEAQAAFIPKDIMANIFKRLSVRSLTRLRCVCTHWKNLINDLIKTPSFIEDHFNCSRCRKPLLLLEQYHRRFRGISLRVLDCDMRVQKVQKLPSTHSLYDFKVLGSSNGLVCVKIENGINPHPILIWNPVTRDIREVRPRTIVHSDLIAEVGLELYRTHIDPRELDDIYGFGFSPLDNDYKIVRINEHNHYDIKAVEVYSLNCGSWKHIDVGDDLDGISTLYRYITINGVMFWQVMWCEDEYLILPIDLSKGEVRKLIPMPDIGGFRRTSLIEYENKLAVVACVVEEDHVSILTHLWVMEENGRRYGWTKIYTSGLSPWGTLDPVTIWMNEIVLLPFHEIENDGHETILYLLDLTANEFKRLPVRSHSSNFDPARKRRPPSWIKRDIDTEIFNYVESFVLVNRHHYN